MSTKAPVPLTSSCRRAAGQEVRREIAMQGVGPWLVKSHDVQYIDDFSHQRDLHDNDEEG